MKYENDVLLEVQKKECYILGEIHKVCMENHIEYFIVGGTALGAVRHKGFIPWDDDIDIGMTRENYERFLNLPRNVFGENLVIADRKYEKNCPFPYAKVRLKGTKFIEHVNFGIKNISTGIYVDVFPFDKVPTDRELYKKQYEKVKKLTVAYVLKKQKNLGAPPETCFQQIKMLIRNAMYYCFKVIPDSIFLKNLKKEMIKYNNSASKEYTCLLTPVPLSDYFTDETLYPLKDYAFENITVKGPNNMDAYLTQHYGDYMELPPPEMRFGHKPYIIDLGNS